MLPSRESASLVPRVSGSANMTEAVSDGRHWSEPMGGSARFESSPLKNGLRLFKLIVGKLGIHREKPVAAGCCCTDGTVAMIVTANGTHLLPQTPRCWGARRIAKASVGGGPSVDAHKSGGVAGKNEG